MSKNTKQTSGRIATLASETLLNQNSSAVAKSLAASALAQRSGDKQTGARMEDVASHVLRSGKFADAAKDLAASVLSQSNKQR